MNITQKPSEFPPVAIILETEEEVTAMWDMMETLIRISKVNEHRDLAVKISNAFSTDIRI